MKTCPICLIEKETAEFYHSNNGRLSGYCKPCSSAYNKKYLTNRCANDKDFVERERKRSESNRQNNKYYRAGQMFSSVKLGARKRKILFEISPALVFVMLEIQEWKCIKTNIDFDLTTGEGTKPFGPTIDRIDNSFGYLPSNIQIVCNMYNYAKNKWSDADVLMFAQSLTRKQKS